MLDDDTFLSGFLGGIFYGLSIADFAIPIGFILWCGIFLVSFKKIDCSHIISALLFICYCCFSGCVLTLVIPSTYQIDYGIRESFMMFVIFAIVSGFFWNNQYKKQETAKTERRQQLLRELREREEKFGQTK